MTPEEIIVRLRNEANVCRGVVGRQKHKVGKRFWSQRAEILEAAADCIEAAERGAACSQDARLPPRMPDARD